MSRKPIPCSCSALCSAQSLLTFGVERTDPSAPDVKMHFAMWSFTGCQKAFLGPHFGKEWCNNLSPWQHLTKHTHWNRNVNVLGNQVSKGPWPEPDGFLYSSLALRGLASKLQPALALEEVREQRLRLTIGQAPPPHPLYLEIRYSCLKGVVGKENRVNFRFSMANRHWYVWYKISGWSNTGIIMMCGMKSLL